MKKFVGLFLPLLVDNPKSREMSQSAFVTFSQAREAAPYTADSFRCENIVLCVLSSNPCFTTSIHDF